MPTPDELTLRQYLQALEERGAKMDADEFRAELPKTTNQSLEELLPRTMAEIKEILAGVVYAEISPLIPKGATEIVLVAEGQEALAAEVMKSEEFNWQFFKNRQRIAYG